MANLKKNNTITIQYKLDKLKWKIIFFVKDKSMQRCLSEYNYWI